MATFVTLEHLQAGLMAWKGRLHWSCDFHNAMYAALDDAKHAESSLTTWWAVAFIRLGEWKALRTSRPGMGRNWIRERGFAQLGEIRDRYEAMLQAHGGVEPDLAQVRFEELEPLLELAREVKDAQSWMFSSKLCHFLLPSAVVVTDGRVTPTLGASYRDYWLRCQEGWQACPN